MTDYYKELTEAPTDSGTDYFTEITKPSAPVPQVSDRERQLAFARSSISDLVPAEGPPTSSGEFPTKLGGLDVGLPTQLMAQFARGAEFGGFDETVGALTPSLLNTPSFLPDLTDDDKRQLGTEFTRNVQNRATREHPVLSTLAQLGGTIASTSLLPFGKLFPARLTPLQAGARSSLVSAPLGGLSGALEADNGDRLFGGAKGASIAALLGFPFGVGAQYLNQYLAGKSGELSNRAILQQLDDSGQPVQDALSELQLLNKASGNRATIADVSPALQQEAGAVSRASPKAVNQATKVLEQRVREGASWLTKRGRKLLGISDDAAQDIEFATQQMKSQASPLYNQAHQESLSIDDNLLPLLKKAGAGVYNRALKIFNTDPDSPNIAWPKFNELKEGSQIPLAVMDYMKRALQGESRKGGVNRELARAQGELSKRFVETLNSRSPTYAKARQMYADDFVVQDALKAGKDFLKTSPEQIKATFSKLDETAKQAYRVGAMQSIEDSFNNANIGSDVTRRVVGKEILKQRLSQLFPDSKSLDDFVTGAEIQGRFAQTRSEVLKGSQTAARQTADEQFAVQAQPSFFKELASGNFKSAFNILTGTQKTTVTRNKELASQVADQIFAQGRDAEQILLNISKAIPELRGKERSFAQELATALDVHITRQNTEPLQNLM